MINDIEKYLEDFKKFMKDIASSSEKSREFLIGSGIYTEDGELSENYKDNIDKRFKNK